MRRKVGRQRSATGHLAFKALTLHAEGTGRFRREESRSQLVKLFPEAEHNVTSLGGIAPASSLAYHVLPLVRRCTDNQNVSQTLRSQIAGRVIVHTVLDKELVLPHSVLTLRKVGETHLTVEQLIRDNEVGLVRVVAVLQGRRHELDLVLVSRNLGEESSRRSDNYGVDDCELLNRRVRKLGHSLSRFLGVLFIVESKEVGEVFDRVPALCQACGAYHHLLGLADCGRIEDRDFDFIHCRSPPLRPEL